MNLMLCKHRQKALSQPFPEIYSNSCDTIVFKMVDEVLYDTILLKVKQCDQLGTRAIVYKPVTHGSIELIIGRRYADARPARGAHLVFLGPEESVA